MRHVPDDKKAQPAAAPQQLRMVTLNVHGWHNETDGAFKRLTKTLRALNPDVVALQEATKHRVPSLARALGFANMLCRHNCALLSPHALELMMPATKELERTRHIAGRVHIPGWPVPVEVVCLHLDHVREPTRFAEAAKLAAYLQQPVHQVWLGDFNALTRTDVSANEWAAIADHRARNAWEAPVSDLTDSLRATTAPKKGRKAGSGAASSLALGLTDAWQVANARRGPLGTSRFGTRIDYCFISRALADAVNVAHCEHVDTVAAETSDHNAVCTTLELRRPRTCDPVMRVETSSDVATSACGQVSSES